MNPGARKSQVVSVYYKTHAVLFRVKSSKGRVADWARLKTGVNSCSPDGLAVQFVGKITKYTAKFEGSQLISIE